MSIKLAVNNVIPVARSIWNTPQTLSLNPAVLRFLSGYMNKFPVRNVDNHLILHSHLPPVNSRAYHRFVKEHLIQKTNGPSHAQIAITNACPQNCACCYNKNRQGRVMDTDTIIKTARSLKQMGVVWLGLTGGEPLLNKDIVKITESVSGDCAIKLFTTGCTLTKSLAHDLKAAGLFSVSVSLDHWTEPVHDAGRGYPGAFKEAIKAIEIFKNANIDIGVSAVLSREMIRNGQTDVFLRFLIDLGVNEAWLSEVKPTVAAYWEPELVITETDRLTLVNLQNRYNRENKITVNYLGHFEGKECFGCNAGNKMVYIDAFGDVSPCVFTPMRFGNVQQEPIEAIFPEMKKHFPSEEGCFMNKNYLLLKKYSTGQPVLDKTTTLKMMQEVKFGPLARFSQLTCQPKLLPPDNTVTQLTHNPEVIR
jgi:MoaA/NifB/PqqE/SkfB family radical SAM enzyme